MAFRLSPCLRYAVIAAVLIAAAVWAPTVAAATPHTKPSPRATIDSVQQQLGKLALQSDQLVEQFNQANNAYTAAKNAAGRAATSYHAVALRLSKARALLSASATAQYEGGSFSAAGALLSSSDGTSYLDQLDTLSMLSSHNAQVVSWYAATQRQAVQANKHADGLYSRAKIERENVQRERGRTAKQINKYTSLLATLNAHERAAWAKRANPASARTQSTARATALVKTRATALAKTRVTTPVKTVTSVHITSAAVKKAVNFALAQVGKPYVWGAAGPGSYDCSGLTMASYRAAGIRLPHSAAEQYNYGHHVAARALRPGDLMFYYQPIGHVTIYIGHGMMVSAPQTGEDVKVIPADTRRDYTGATRLVR